MKRNQFSFILAINLIIGFMVISCSKIDLDSSGRLANDRALNSRILKTSDLNPIEQLGKNIYFDKISSPNSMACADCHAPSVGFTGPIVGINIHGSVYRGADAQNFGNRKPPSAAYATFSPILHINSEGIFEGGNFWDGRATGERLGSPAAEQALGPFLNPAEHNLTSALEVLRKIEKTPYIYLWKEVYGEPFSTATDKISLNYDRVGLAIAAYEGSSEVNKFSSKFDCYLKGQVMLTPEEELGMSIFNGKGKCNLCHISEGENPLFTDFTFDNLGTPKNPENPVYKNNPAFIDPGLGGFLESVPAWSSLAGENMGKHKVPTLRNVDKKPGLGFTKAYMHNGVFKSLKEVVHFYNTRDVAGMGWPAPEVAENVNVDELGNLQLTDAEENAIVAFMRTLSDGYVIK